MSIFIRASVREAALATDTVERTFGQRSARVFAFAAVASIVGLLAYLAGQLLFAEGFVAQNILFFGEKVDLALHGAPPKLVNIGFIYPPLSFALVLPFGNAFIAQAVVAGLIVATFIDILDRAPISNATRWVAKLYIVFSPLILFSIVEDFSQLLFSLCVAASIKYFARFLERNYSLHLFVASLLLGVAFFVDFRSGLVLLAVIPAMMLPFLRREHFTLAVSIGLTIALPTAFFASAWAYVNLIFMGDPFNYVTSQASYFRSFDAGAVLLAKRGDIGASAQMTLTELFGSLPITIPYFVGLVLLRGRQIRSWYTVPLLVVYLSPIALVGLSIFNGIYRPSVSFLTLFVFTLLLSLERMRRSPWLTASLLVSFVASFFVALHSPDAEERSFVRSLLTGKIEANLGEYHQVGDLLTGVSPRERVLVDDTFLFPLVKVVGDPQRFILPYQYEYASAVSNPRAFARYVVVARRPEDALMTQYPAAERGVLKGYREIGRTPRFIAFERIRAPL